MSFSENWPLFGGGTFPPWSKQEASGERHMEGQGSWGVSHPASHIGSAKSWPDYLHIQLLGLNTPNVDFEIIEEEFAYLLFCQIQAKFMELKVLREKYKRYLPSPPPPPKLESRSGVFSCLSFPGDWERLPETLCHKNPRNAAWSNQDLPDTHRMFWEGVKNCLCVPVSVDC